MKKSIILFSILCLTVSSLLAQRDATIFKGKQRGGFFFTPWLTEYGQFNGDTRPSFGGGFGVITGDLFIGGYGLGNTDYEDFVNNGEINEISLAHGGLWLGYVPMQHKAIHPYSNLRLGWGAVKIDENSFDTRTIDGVNVITPELGVEINVFRWLRIAGTGGYRWVNDVDSPSVGSKDFNGWTAGLNVRIGWFGRDRNWQDRDKARKLKD